MRNLKKVLSLALALVMLLGMMVVGAGAATTSSFVDSDDIQNVEAADVTVALGLIEGDKGNFMPNGTLTRAEAAVIITRLLLGPSAASLLKATNNDFSDLSGYGWAAPAIAYCSSYGIVEGDGNGHFYPGNKVTGFQFGKMLLVALGYEAEIQGYNGGGYTVFVATDAHNIGLDTNLVMSSTALTRDEAVQMVLNMLTCDMVTYEEYRGVSRAVSVTTNSSASYDGNNDRIVQFCEKNFPSLTLKKTTVDAMQRPTHTWYVGRTMIGEYMDPVYQSYVNSVSPGTIYNDLALGETVKAENVSLFIDGKEVDPAPAIARGVATPITGSNKGVLTEVWYNEDEHSVRITMINTYVGNIATVKTSDGTVTVAASAKFPGASASSLNKTTTGTGYDINDLVAYTAAYNEETEKYDIYTLRPLTVSTTGTLTAWTGTNYESGGDYSQGNSSFTAGGNRYEWSAQSIIVSPNGGANGNIYDFTAGSSTINVYLDEYGYALYVEPVAASTNYAVVIGTGGNNPYGSATTGATLLFPDGTIKEVTYKLAVSGINLTSSNTVDEIVGDIVTYSVDADGVYTLSVHEDWTSGIAAGAVDQGDLGKWATEVDAPNDVVGPVGGPAKSTFKNGESAIVFGPTADLYTTKNTIFFVCTGTAPDLTYSVYTGYNEMPSFTEDGILGYAVRTNSYYSRQVDAVYIAATELAGMAGANLYFVKSGFDATGSDANGSYYILPAIEDGQETTIKVRIGASRDAVFNNGTTGLFAATNVVRDEFGVVTKFTDSTSSAFMGTVTNTSSDQAGIVRDPSGTRGVLGIGETRISGPFNAYTSDTRVFLVDENYRSISIGSVNSIQDDANDLIYAAVVTGTQVLADVIIVEQADPEDPDTYTLSWTVPTTNVSNVEVKIGDGAAATSPVTELDGGETITVSATVTSDWKLAVTVGGTTKEITNETTSQTFTMPSSDTTITFSVKDANLVSQEELFYLLHADSSKSGLGTGDERVINVFHTAGNEPTLEQMIADISEKLGLTDVATQVSVGSGTVTFTVPDSTSPLGTRVYKLTISGGVIEALKGTIDNETVFVVSGTALNALTTLGKSSYGKFSSNALKGTFVQINDGLSTAINASTGYETGDTDDGESYAKLAETISASGFELTSNFVEVKGDNGSAKAVVIPAFEDYEVPEADDLTSPKGTGFKYVVSGGETGYVEYEGTIQAAKLVGDVTLTQSAVTISYALSDAVKEAGWTIDATDAGNVYFAVLQDDLKVQVKVDKEGHGLSNGQNTTTNVTPTLTASDDTSAATTDSVTLKWSLSNPSTIETDIVITITEIKD